MLHSSGFPDIIAVSKIMCEVLYMQQHNKFGNIIRYWALGKKMYSLSCMQAYTYLKP